MLMVFLAIIGIILILTLGVFMETLSSLFAIVGLIKWFCIDLWFISIPIIILTIYSFSKRWRKKSKAQKELQQQYDEIVYRINRNKKEYDYAKTSTQYRKVYEEYKDIINTIHERQLIELYDIKNVIEEELPKIKKHWDYQ